MSVISASSAGVKDMADGSLRITFEFEPRHAADAFALFGPRGRAVAIAALKDGHGAVADEQPVQAEQKTAGQPENRRSSEKLQERMGDLCWRAVMWCKEPEFWDFLNLSAWGGEHVDDEDKAARRVKFLCNVGSRKDIDGNADATQRFHRHIRGPYQKHLMARGINR